MSPVDIFIIFVATVTAIAFKYYLFKRIQCWMDNDLIKGLADNDSQKLQFLQTELTRLKAQKCKRNQLHEKLTTLAKNYSA